MEKKRIGAKYHRRYDKPQTPYQRLLTSNAVPEPRRQQLAESFAQLNPFQLKKTIESKLKRIFDANKVPPQ